MERDELPSDPPRPPPFSLNVPLVEKGPGVVEGMTLSLLEL